jgi:dihydroorotase
MASLLFKDGILMTARGPLPLDLLVQNGQIVDMGKGLPAEGVDEVVDASAHFVLPGLIDAHVHLRTPGEEQKEDWTTGGRAALAGGFTTVLDMPNNHPPIISQEALKQKRSLVQPNALTHFDLYMGATADNVEEFLKSDAVALKIYMGSSTGSLLVDRLDTLEEIFKRVGETDRLICVHAEDQGVLAEARKRHGEGDHARMHPKMRPPEAALSAVQRALELAVQYNTRLHVCHVSTAAEVALLKSFCSERISSEVTPHHLFLDESALEDLGNKGKVNPPLRTLEDNVALLAALATGDIDIVATDHAPHLLEEKNQLYVKAPSGVPGLEICLALLLNAVNLGQLSLQDVVRATSTRPAHLFKLEDRGSLDIGQKADLVMVDMNLEKTVENGGPGARYTKPQWSPFAGRSFKGWPVMTVVDGEIRMKNGQILV